MTPPPFGGVTVDNTLYMGVFGDECDKYSAVSGLSDDPKNPAFSASRSKSPAKDEVNLHPSPNVTITQVKIISPTKTGLTLKKGELRPSQGKIPKNDEEF